MQSAAAIGLVLRIDPMVVLNASDEDGFLYGALAIAAADLRFGKTEPATSAEDET